MNGAEAQRRAGVDQQLRESETRAAEDLATIRLLGEQWESHRQVVRESSRRFEEAGMSMGAKNYFVQKSLAARRELDSYVAQLDSQQAEMLDETAREIRSGSEAAVERLRQKEAGALWG